jgi:hypothetical protein
VKKQELVSAYLKGRIDRRRFVRSLIAGGVTATAAVTYADVLAAGASGPVPRKVPLSIYPFPGNDGDGEPVLIGQFNTNLASSSSSGGPGGPTVIRGSTTGPSGDDGHGTYPNRVAMIIGEQHAAGQFGVQGVATAPGSPTAAAGIGVVATSVSGAALVLSDTSAPIPPLGGGLTSFWDTGAFVVNGGHVWYCLASGVGNASQWVKLSSTLVLLPAPVRVYDSRPGANPTGVGPKTQLAVGEDRQLNMTVNSSGVPVTASAVLLNLAVTGTGPSGFLGVFKDGIAYPNNANINWSFPSQNLSNAVTSAVANSGKLRVHCGGSPTDVVIDVIGYYL